MNRSVMDRQMFKKGGAAGFPDLSGDGKVTQKDILMGRGVIGMQQGGMAPMPAQMPAGPGPEVMAGGLSGIDPNSIDINQAAQGAMQQGIDPAMLEGMLGQYASQMNDLENAQDYEEVMNGIRGDDRPIEQRYQELAGIVGQEDAQQTPESVLALVQPVMMMAAVDQGIGGLAMEEMAAPVEGAMAEGIMSTVNMGQEEPAPVNFNEGGPVQYMADGGLGGRLGDIYRERQELYQSVMPVDPAQAFQEQKDLTQAQMLFDIAQGALMFATPGERRMSPAERLAQSFTPVLGNIGARAGELQKFKQSQTAQQQALNLQALGAAETRLAAEIAAGNEDIGDVYNISASVPNPQTGAIEEVQLGRRPLTRADYKKLTDEYGEQNLTITLVPKTTATGSKTGDNFVLPDGSMINVTPGTAAYQAAQTAGGLKLTSFSPDMVSKRKQVTLNTEITIGGKTYRAGSSPNLTEAEINALAGTYGADFYTAYQAPVSDRDVFNRFGFRTKAEFDALPEETQQYLQGLPILTDADYFNKFGMTKNDFTALDPVIQQELLGVAPNFRFERLEGADGSVRLLKVNERTNETVDVFDETVTVEPKYARITINNVPQVVDVRSPEGRKLVAKVNELNTANPGSATYQNIATEDITPRSFYVPGSDTVEGGVYTSYDGGRTFTDMDGNVQQMPNNKFEVSNTIAYDVNKKARVSAGAQRQLDAMDASFIKEMTVPVTDGRGKPVLNDDGTPKLRKLTEKEVGGVRDALREARLGTGFWSKVYAGIDGLLGGTIAPEYFSNMFREEQDARQYVEMVRVFGRSALSASPRFAVADLETTAQLFPDERAFFRNPVTESRKLVRLAEELETEKRRILTLRASGDPIDNALNSTLSQKLFEIERLEGLLGPILTLQSTASRANMDRAQQIMNQASGQGG